MILGTGLGVIYFRHMLGRENSVYIKCLSFWVDPHSHIFSVSILSDLHRHFSFR